MNGLGLGLVVTVAAAISAGIVLALLPLLHRYALAHPNARSSHRRATPQGAGLAVIVATLLVAAVTGGGRAALPTVEGASPRPGFRPSGFLINVCSGGVNWENECAPPPPTQC